MTELIKTDTQLGEGTEAQAATNGISITIVFDTMQSVAEKHLANRMRSTPI
ncbi:MAG: hypothetical protein HY016_07475 [Nitrosomonadales bacterium]|nr:hypothetical protein [Nitrosomonadales bacterium]